MPPDLRIVPPAPDDGADEHGDAKRAAWMAWAERLSAYRIERKLQIASHPELIPFELERCRASAAYFLCTWGWIFEQRLDDDGEGGGAKPWIMFPAQIEMLNWLDDRLQAKGTDRDGVVSKARDMGASWTCCGWALHGWLFRYPWTILMLSRKEDLVDSRKSDSLFWKIRFLLRRIEKEAPWMLPDGFTMQNKQHLTHMALVNPVTGSEIIGESTNANAGRGSRATAAIIDEAAFVPDLMDIWNGLSASTKVRVAVSSESLQQGPDFFALGVGNQNARRPALFALDWWQNPHHDLDWLDEERGRYANRPDDFEKEVLRNARAGNNNFVYPYAINLRIEDIDYKPNYPLYVSIDPGMRDETAIIWVQIQDGRHVVLASYQNNTKPAEFYGTILTGQPDPQFTGLYTEYDYDIMRWTATLPRAKFNGDNYGDSVMGGSTDSFYSILRKKFGIHVNIDRTPDGKAVGWRTEVRYAPGRRQAVRELLPQMAFSNRRNAGFVLQCLQESQFPPQSGSSVSEQKDAIHDWTSHMRQAVEFYAAFRRSRLAMDGMNQFRRKERDKRNSRDQRGHVNYKGNRKNLRPRRAPNRPERFV